MRVLLVVLCLVAASITAGCMGGGSDNNPRFVAEFYNPPPYLYDQVSGTLNVAITNVQEIKTGQTVGEGGTHQVCMHINGPIHRDADGKPLCQLVGLANRETKYTDWRLPDLDAGAHTVRVLNASLDLEVRETPKVGDRINGSLVDITLVSGKETENTSWEWDLQVEYHNRTQPVDVRFQTTFGSRLIDWAGDSTRAVLESTYLRPAGRPVTAVVLVDDEQVDRGLYVWCCAGP